MLCVNDGHTHPLHQWGEEEERPEDSKKQQVCFQSIVLILQQYFIVFIAVPNYNGPLYSLDDTDSHELISDLKFVFYYSSVCVCVCVSSLLRSTVV